MKFKFPIKEEIMKYHLMFEFAPFSRNCHLVFEMNKFKSRFSKKRVVTLSDEDFIFLTHRLRNS